MWDGDKEEVTADMERKARRVLFFTDQKICFCVFLFPLFLLLFFAAALPAQETAEPGVTQNSSTPSQTELPNSNQLTQKWESSWTEYGTLLQTLNKDLDESQKEVQTLKIGEQELRDSLTSLSVQYEVLKQSRDDAQSALKAHEESEAEKDGKILLLTADNRRLLIWALAASVTVMAYSTLLVLKQLPQTKALFSWVR